MLSVDENIFRLRIQQYQRMIDAGIFRADDAVELLEGRIYRLATKTPAHSTATRRTVQAIRQLMPPDLFVETHQPVTTVDSEPTLDVAIIRGDIDEFARRHPAGQDVPLAIEVADLSLEHDRTIKLRTYAGAGISTYWIVNLVGRVIEAYADPSATAQTATYMSSKTYGESESIELTIDGQVVGTIAVRHVLP